MKKHKARKFILLCSNRLISLRFILVLFLSISSSVYSQSDSTLFTLAEKEWLKAHPVLTIGVDPDFMPFESINADGKYMGLAAEYVTQLEHIMGIQMVPAENLTWQQVLECARSGSIDVVACLGYTVERQKYLTFTKTYLNFQAVIIAKNTDKSISGMDSLKTKTTAIVNAYWVDDIMKLIYPDLKTKRFSTGRQCLESVLLGESDAYISDLASASYLLKELGFANLRVSGYAPYSLDLRMGARQGIPELVSILNKSLDAISDVDKNTIYTNWIRLKEPSIFETESFRYFFSGIVLLVVLTIFVIIMWNRSLKKQVTMKTKQLKQELAERKSAEDKFHKVFQHAADAIGLVRLNDGTYLEINNTFVKILGYTLDEVIGHTSLEFKLFENSNDRSEIYRQLLSGQRLENYEANWRTKKGEIRYGLLSTELIDIEGDSCITFVWHDITDRKINEKALLDAMNSLEKKVQERTAELAIQKERAEFASKAKSVFLSNVSHELRTPLNAILGYSRLLLRDESLGESQLKDLMIINHSGEHLLKLINEVLDISRIEAGKTVLTLSTFNLQGLLRDVETMFQIQAEEKKIQLRFVYPVNLIDTVISDESKLRQILINLIGNAIKFTDKGLVEVSVYVTAVTGDRMRLFVEVSDTGPGISEQDLANLFMPFHQSASGHKLGSGTGLGLAISRDFARLMAGDIVAVSTVGKGSSFKLELPIQESAERPSSISIESRRVIGLAPGQKTYKILVADDIPVNRSLLARLLGIIGMEVREAKDGNEAIILWKEWHPDLILMDLRMPGLDGYEAMKIISENDTDPKTKIIVVTASAFDGDRKRVIETSGAIGYLRKPVVEEDLFASLSDCLGLVYTYEASQSVSDASASTVFDYTIDDLPSEIVIRLRSAALEADIEQINSVLESIEKQFPKQVNGIHKMIEEFRYDLLIQLLNTRSLTP